jgi:hypothetical protein
MDMNQYPYAQHNRQQDVMASSSAQHLLLQQYDMRQLQMYHSQPDRHRAGVGQAHHAQAPGIMLQHVVPSGSFDTTGEYQVSTYGAGAGAGADQRQHPSVMPMVGSNPMLVPMGVTMAGLGRGGTPKDQHAISGVPMPSHAPHQSAGVQSNERQQSGVSHQVERETQYMSVSPDDSSQFSPGKMNPEATAFAPSYMGHQGTWPMVFSKGKLPFLTIVFLSFTGGHQPTQQVYFPFPTSSTSAYARAPTHHPNLYAQGMMYIPAAGASTVSVPGDASASMTVSSGDDGSSKDQKVTPEKENNMKSAWEYASERWWFTAFVRPEPKHKG